MKGRRLTIDADNAKDAGIAETLAARLSSHPYPQPCKFCGCPCFRVEQRDALPPFQSIVWWRIVCANCQATGPKSYMGVQAAIAKWNATPKSWAIHAGTKDEECETA